MTTTSKPAHDTDTIRNVRFHDRNEVPALHEEISLFEALTTAMVQDRHLLLDNPALIASAVTLRIQADNRPWEAMQLIRTDHSRRTCVDDILAHMARTGSKSNVTRAIDIVLLSLVGHITPAEMRTEPVFLGSNSNPLITVDGFMSLIYAFINTKVIMVKRTREKWSAAQIWLSAHERRQNKTGLSNRFASCLLEAQLGNLTKEYVTKMFTLNPRPPAIVIVPPGPMATFPDM